MSLKYFHRTLGGLNYIWNEKDLIVTGYSLGGRVRNLANPMMKWYNGSTYAVGYKSAANLSAVYVTKQTGNTVDSYLLTGSGTATVEPFNHPAPIILIDDAGYIYVIQNTYHVDSFRIWKSDSIEDVSAFTLVGTFDTDGSYLALLKQSNTDVTFSTRSGESPNGYDFNILEVDLTDASYTDLLTVEMAFATNGVRAYLGGVIFYGTSTYRAVGVNPRKESNSTYYKYCVLVTSDFDTYYNIGLGFSKDIPATSAITFAELDANYNFIGSDAANSTDISACNMIQINDEIFVSYRTGAGTYSIKKADIVTGTTSEVALGLSLYNATNGDNNVYMYYNGSNIVLTVRGETVGKIYTIETDLTGLTYERDIPTLDAGDYVGLPSNLNDVDDLYLIIGRAEATNTVPYIVTNNKWS